MSYAEDVLIQGEKIVYETKVSLWSMAIPITIGIATSFILIGLFILLYVYLVYRSTEIAITNKRIIYKTGFISRKTMEINLPKVESIQVEQSIVGRVFDFGTVTISGTGSHQAEITHVKKPVGLRNAFANIASND